MKESTDNKMSMLSCITMSIGAIIGAGLFSMLPLGIEMVGFNVGWAFIAAAVFVILRTLPMLYIQSALPVSGSTYVYLSRMVHPVVAYIQSLNSVIGALNIAVMSMTFANYFCQLFPNSELNVTIVAIVCALFFAFVGTFGAKMTGKVQNIIVGLLIVALGCYVFFGLGAIDHTLTFANFVKPTIDFAGLWGAVAILNYTLQGGAVVASFADEVEKPEKTIPWSFFIGTGVVTFIYIIIGYITLGAGPVEGAANAGYNLGAIAETFMSPIFVKFFIVVGALFATITTLNGSFLIYSRLHAVTARDGIWPKALAKTNKYNVPHISLWVCTIFAVVMIATGIPLNDILKIVSVPGLLLGVIFYIPSLIFVKRYPNAAARSYMPLNRWSNILLSVFAIVMSFYLGWNLLTSLTKGRVISMLVFYVAGYAYYFVRWAYMKKKHNIDIIEIAKAPIASWETLNAPLTEAETVKFAKRMR